MGLYLNPGNEGFQQIRNGLYIDKTDLIDYINSTLNTSQKMTCFSRPRRFGKSYAAKMLCAYYDKTCNSYTLFHDLKITNSPNFTQYLNQYNVIYLDISRFISLSSDLESIIDEIEQSVKLELQEEFPNCILSKHSSLADSLFCVSSQYKLQFFIIIDEWDALFREAKENVSLQKDYIQFLRGLFKGGPATDTSIAGVYMTGILPIKKYGTESALTDFKEFTMIKPRKLAKYVGFTEDEVWNLCQKYDMDFSTMQQWYDGYSFSKLHHIYSPNSVINAIQNEEFDNYWTNTESYESLKNYISMNLDGLKDSIIAMLGGQPIDIDSLNFQNDFINMKNRDNVLTLLVHLGYLGYDAKEGKVYIPNLEVADSFKLAVQDTGWEEIAQSLMDSKKLLNATIEGNAKLVASTLDKIHSSTSSILQYNNENSLACALTIAYYTAKSDYMIIRELPSGKGFADLAFIPRKHSNKPALIIELKYNETPHTAIRQIKEKCYGGELVDYLDNLLLVGINYNKTTKKHECIIEKAERI